MAKVRNEIKAAVHQGYTKFWERFARPGNVAFDLYCIRGPVRGVSDEQRVQAAERIVSKLSYLVDRRRWRWVEDALRARSSNPKNCVQDHARSLIFLAVDHIFQDPEFLRMSANMAWHHAVKVLLPREINNLLTEDVLAPEWRHIYEKNKYGLTPEIPLYNHKMEIAHDVEKQLTMVEPGYAEFEAVHYMSQRLAQSSLTPRQVELVGAMARTFGVLKDACEIIGMKEPTAKVQLSRIRKKMQ